ncbi:MAG TPA: GrpB family protein [Gemmatimonadaceae bacterium]
MMSSLGLESGVVRLVEYDPQWPILFQEEAQRISLAISPLTLKLHHVGSTAVPELVGKPVLDILAGYDDPASRSAYISALCAAGYQHRGEQEIPGRDFFRRGMPRAYHVHLARAGSDFWHEHLTFRNLLRLDPVLREQYASLKRQLAMKYPRDRESYIDGKGPFIREVLGRTTAARQLGINEISDQEGT